MSPGGHAHLPGLVGEVGGNQEGQRGNHSVSLLFLHHSADPMGTLRIRMLVQRKHTSRASSLAVGLKPENTHTGLLLFVF